MIGWLLTVRLASAATTEAFGFGAEQVAQGGAGAASAGGVGWAFLNPTALRLEGRETLVGVAWASFQPTALPGVRWDTDDDGMVDAEDPPLMVDASQDEPVLRLGFARGFGRLAVGGGVVLPLGPLVVVEGKDPALPSYPILGHRLERYEVLAVASAEPLRGFRLGAGAEMSSKGQVGLTLRLQAAYDGTDPSGLDFDELGDEALVDVEHMSVALRPTFVPLVGARLELGELVDELEGWALGGAWRGATGLPVEVDVDVEADIGLRAFESEGTVPQVAVNVPMSLMLIDHWIPRELRAGLAHEGERWDLALDVRHTAWSKLPAPVVELVEGAIDPGTMPLPAITVSDANQATPSLRDVWSVRGGASWRIAPEGPWALRAGAGFLPHALVAAGPGASYLDADRVLGSAGVGWSRGPWNLDTFAQVHRLVAGRQVVDDPFRAGAPVEGTHYPVGGVLWTAGLACTVRE